MLTRFSRALILLAAAGVAYAGPVAACLCVTEAMEQMPCCPDDARQQDQAPCAQPDSAAAVACDPVPTDLLATVQDLSPPVAISAGLVLPSVHGPPASSLASSPPPHDSPPIYLTTLRLRI